MALRLFFDSLRWQILLVVAAMVVLMFLLGFNAHNVFALAWRAHRAKVHAPRRGALVYLRPHGPQAVRKERRA